MSRYIIETATPTDDEGLKKILGEDSMGSHIQLAFQREPSFFQANRLGNNFSQVVVIKDKISNKIIGCAGRSTKLMYVNGEVKEIGYLNNLRISREYRNGNLLSRGFKYLKELHRDGRVPIYLETIIEGNTHAMDILTSKRLELPVHSGWGDYYSVAVNIFRKKKNIKNSIKIEKGSTDRLSDIVECLQRNGATKQFYPYYKKEDFISKNRAIGKFNINDFYVALKKDKVVGVLAKWDQRESKQVVVTGYKGMMKIRKPIFNVGAKIFGFSALPQPGSQLNFYYVSFIAIDFNNVEIFRSMLRTLYNDSIGMGYSYFLIGLHADDPLLKVAREYNRIVYKSRAFIVYWEDGEKFYRDLDNRVPYLEIATL